MENVREILSCEWPRHEIVNYALHQNFVPIIQKIALRNESEEDLRDITVRIRTEPDLATEWTKSVERIPTDRTVEIGQIHLRINGTLLAELTERISGSLILEVSQGERMLYREESRLTVLAYDQWGGLLNMPEMIAAFIMPNHPVVTQIISEASAYLGQWTNNPSFDAYQSQNPNRVKQQAAAIYTAIQDHQPTYNVAPASFEEIGQRVRLPDAVIGSRLGNCLDLTLLYAACLEAIGLHPLIVITQGHAFPGVWLVQETFSESIQDDLSLLTKRLAAGVHEISIVEATWMCAGNHASYQEAEQAAAAHLSDPNSFYGFLDVQRARGSGIRPIPIRIPTPNGWEILANKDIGDEISTSVAPEEMTIHARPTEVDSIVMTKQKQWERRLLDLTLRNPLLNFRMTKSSLLLLNTRLGELEDALAEGQEFQLLPKPADWDNTPRSAELFQSALKDHPLSLLIHQEFLNKRLRADTSERELAGKVVHLYRAARTSLEENGANTLYLALGLLKWYESAVSEQPRFAPIILVPVEFIRKSTSAGFILRIRDEESQINITLLEMIRQDFGSHIGGLDPLPRDEKGIDLAGVFSTVRHVIMNLPRWDIVETAIVGLFSFSRFVMWNDIRSRAEDLAKNKVVASLMSGRLEWNPGEAFPNPGRLDEMYKPNQLLLPISADSSQISAISAAQNDHSFVLHGPPGTGKSQTITNMIASALANGKTVLFVAEKMAALTVVQNRLEQIGLGPFCLELHSNKSTKKAVLEQLRRTLEIVRTASPEEWTSQAERVASSRDQLNVYAASLHRSYRFGATLFEAITGYSQLRAAPTIASFESAAVGAMSKEQYIAWTDRVKELQVAAEAAGHPHGHAWSDVNCNAYTPVLRAKTEELLASMENAIQEVGQNYSQLVDWLKPASHGDISRENLIRLAEVCEILGRVPNRIPTALLRSIELDMALHQVEGAIGHGTLRDEARSRLQNLFSEEALAMDANTVLEEWKKSELQWFLPKLLKRNRIVKMIKGFANAGTSVDGSNCASYLSMIIQYQSEAAALKQVEPSVSPLFGVYWNNGEIDWTELGDSKNWVGTLQETLLRYFGDAGKARQARERLADLLASGIEGFREQQGHSLEKFASAARRFIELEIQLAELLNIDWVSLDHKRGEQAWLVYREGRARQWHESIGTLREWSTWRQIRDKTVEAGLSTLVESYENGHLRHDEVIPAFQRAWWTAVIEYILEEDKLLASFSGRLFEEKIRSFQEMSDQFEQLTRQEIAARLAAQIPPIHNQAAANSEAGILLRAIRSGGRGVSLRKLFEQIPNLLTRLCPCVLMSPMSVAQYLDPKYAPFDLVIFDEASQMPTSEAVGAMARGRNVIVVGDPNQLPPTSFFSSSFHEETEDSVVPEDLESILDDCLALGMPQEHLLWHYRSRHESLIAFSNRHFYENKLLTFPSPYERISNVRWHPVEGYYDRGKTKHNRAEAEHIVAEISRRLRNTELSKRSMGVVTFNSIQQSLIEDLLDEAYRRDSELETLAARLHEPIFVKNLENVQGDERDVILFSIGYGPDADGKVVLNFGPLNREGGWRRLNVAVSRARYEMHVFSTLRANHLDVSRTRAQGVSVLRSFLEYAEKGSQALGMEAEQIMNRSMGIEEQIAETLRQEGYKVDVNVGASGYRMDVAIVDPDVSGTYILAVLCDGKNYRTGKTARDREVLRGQVLQQLDWRIHRVWSMDWLENPSREIQRIIEAIRHAQSDKATANQTNEIALPLIDPIEEEPVYLLLNADSPLPTPMWGAEYKTSGLTVVSQPVEDFYEWAHSRLIKKQITQVIQEEGPISKSLLLRRVLAAWGISRSGARIERHFYSLISAMQVLKTTWESTEFYWPMEVDPEQYDIFRVAIMDDDRRSAEDLPPEEIANAVREVLFNQAGLPLEELIKETVKLLGYSRTGTALDKAMRNGVQVALKRGFATMDNGRVSYRR